MQNANLIEQNWLPDSTRIGPSKTVADWLAIRKKVGGSTPEEWEKVFDDFFKDRLDSRYLEPIRILQDRSDCDGEGFSIVAIQCSLIEFLEATRQGRKYRNKTPKAADRRDDEYYSSKEMFVAFLENHQPFASIFSGNFATDFYVNVRCGILHEARTNGGWLIRACDASASIADTSAKILYRDDFQRALELYISAYREQVRTDSALQNAFIQKFDDLCSLTTDH